MTIRLTLLVLLTGLFAAAWSNDARHGEAVRLARMQRATNGAVARHEPVVIELPAPIEEIEEREISVAAPILDYAAGPVLPVLPTIVQPVSRRDVPMVDARPVNWQARATKIVTEFDGVPLPTGIRPGTYRAVSNHGEVRQVRLTADDLGGASADEAQDLYIYRDGECRWYFVRLDAVEDVSRPPAVAERPAELIAERAARQTLARIGQRLRAAAGHAVQTVTATTESTPSLSERIASVREWISARLPADPVPMWSGRPAEAERR